MKFKKYQGLGNDFVIIEEDITIEQVNRLCNRHFGIGADGVIVHQIRDGKPYMHFYNQDGSIASMCGNGIRCYADYLYKKGEDYSVISTPSGDKHIKRVNGEYRVFMGKPKVMFQDKLIHGVTLDFIYTGTEHALTFEDKDIKFLEDNYEIIEEDKEYFPIGTNLSVVKVKDRNHIEILTHERGVGITLACGTGSCACAYASYIKGLVDNKCYVRVLGGTLFIEMEEEGIYMTGPGTEVFSGEIKL